jgi:hypothetical protein
MLDLLHSPLAFTQPRRVVEPLGWAEHIPFAFALMHYHQPSLLVELGTHTGVSYAAFCQAVDALQLPTKCYAVDTWVGDEHAGFYGEEVFQEFSRYHDQHYKNFSHLLRMPFDDALSYFSEGTIDLLHIDGCHAYESVKHDFETWLPKVSERGIVLLHDTFAKERGFGVGLFLEEIRASYPVFEFTHSWGLGVLAVGRKLSEHPLWDLFQAGPEETVVIRRFFSNLGSRITLEHELIRTQGRLAQREALLAEQEAQILELHQYRQTLENTFSWRLTKPLRWLGRALKR